MSSSISGIPTTRISNLFIREQLMNQIQSTQAKLFTVQTQLSTGHRFQAPSDDPVAALQVMSIQSILERKAQIKTNLDTNQNFLNVTDSALSGVSNLLTDIRSTALSVTGTTVTNLQRQAAAEQVGQVIRQLLNTGNQQYTGRYLFAGSESAQEPFKYVGDNIQYVGNEQELSSYADLNLLFDTNLNGNQVFGAISSQVQGAVKITPDLTYNTRLADLRQGQGISKGGILVSDGTNSSTIDLSGAETIGDLAAIIHAHPPEGRELYVDITADKIIIQLDDAGGGSLSIREVGGGTVADELGIRRDNGVGLNPITGRALQPILRGTTSLQDILGAYAGTVVHSTGSDNDILLRADTMGATTSTGVALNDVQVTMLDDPAVSVGHEYIVYNPVARTITAHIDGGYTQASQVINKINQANDAGWLPFTAVIDPTDNINDGQGVVEAGATAVTRDGAGEPLDLKSGLRITNGGQEFNVSLATANTVEDVLNAINANTGLLAQINETKDGINIRSRDSGADFMIGENGGKTAAQLGLRTFTVATPMEDLNFGKGVGVAPDYSTTGIDFTIVRNDGAELEIDLSDAETIGDVLHTINTNPLNADGKLVARLAVFGNGIELVDTSTGAGELTVIPDQLSSAAVDLGLVPADGDQSDPSTLNYAAKLVSAAPKSSIIFSAKDSSTDYSGVEIVFSGTATGVTYNELTHRLTIGIVPGTTTAENVVEAVNQSDAASLFYAALDPNDGNPNDGSGVVDATSEFMTEIKVLDGRDVNKTETEGVFTALIRLKHALETNDLPEINRSIGVLDTSSTNLVFTRAELGTQQQGLDVMLDRLSSENIELQTALSNNYDADIVQAASDLSGLQIAYEAALRATASIMQMSLLDYL